MRPLRAGVDHTQNGRFLDGLAVLNGGGLVVQRGNSGNAVGRVRPPSHGAERTIGLGAGPGLAGIAARELAATALAWLVLPAGVWLVHAAGIVLDSGAALVPGHTGAGKSTAAAAAVAAERQVLGDDLAAVRLGRAGP